MKLAGELASLVISAFLISIENFYLVEKQNKENFERKKFVDTGIVKICDELDLSVARINEPLESSSFNCLASDLFKKEIPSRKV